VIQHTDVPCDALQASAVTGEGAIALPFACVDNLYQCIPDWRTSFHL